MIGEQEKDFSNAIQEFHQTITLIGIKETINALKSGRDRVNKEDDSSKISIVKDIILSVFEDAKCLEFKKTDNNKFARCLLAYNLKKIGIKNRKIAAILKVNERTISNFVSFIKSANLINPRVPSEKLLKEAYDKINEKLNNK